LISIQREFRYFDSTCLCFLLLALIQFYTCQNRFRNLTARITQIQYDRMVKSRVLFISTAHSISKTLKSFYVLE
jgi:hypothetical protein